MPNRTRAAQPRSSGPVSGRRHYNPRAGERRRNLNIKVAESLHRELSDLATRKGLSLAGISVELLDRGLAAMREAGE